MLWGKRFFHTKNGQYLYLLYKHKVFANTIYGQLFYMGYGEIVLSVNYGQAIYMVYGHNVLSIQYMDKLSIYCMGGIFYVQITYRQLFHMLYEQLHFHCASVRPD